MNYPKKKKEIIKKMILLCIPGLDFMNFFFFFYIKKKGAIKIE
jgi:hypothetical protein